MKFVNQAKDKLPILLVLLSFTLPFCILFYVDPASFSRTWWGRTYYLFFLWLIVLEMILDWERITQQKINLRLSRRTLLLIGFSILPLTYVIVVYFAGLESVLLQMVEWLGIPLAPVPRPSWTGAEWVLSLEYLVFTVLFAAIVLLSFGKEGLKTFSSSLLFVGAIGIVYMVDTLYPFGHFAPLQAFVPFTASLAAVVLNFLGYQTAFASQYEGTPVLAAYDSSGRFLVQYAVGWPCAGVQSMLIYTFVMLLFLKRTPIPSLHRIVYFAVGAIVTYGINIIRIVAIYMTYINNLSQGRDAARVAADLFHTYYGGLLSMSWIVAYPLLIIGTRMLWSRMRNRPAKPSAPA